MATLLSPPQTGERRQAVGQHLRANGCIVILERLLNGHIRLPEMEMPIQSCSGHQGSKFDSAVRSTSSSN
jgi:hypothetical protein